MLVECWLGSDRLKMNGPVFSEMMVLFAEVFGTIGTHQGISWEVTKWYTEMIWLACKTYVRGYWPAWLYLAIQMKMALVTQEIAGKKLKWLEIM